MSDTLENRLRGIYEVGYNAEFGHRDFSKHVPAINIEAANEIAKLKELLVEANLELRDYETFVADADEMDELIDLRDRISEAAK